MRAISYLSPNLFFFYESVTQAIGRALGHKFPLYPSPCAPLEDSALLDDQLDLAFICGLPFIQNYQAAPDQFSTLFAPVMQGTRYKNKPIYFSDVIATTNSGIESADDLGGVFCYNDTGSNSGYNAMRYWLLQAGHTNGFFSHVITSGSHQNSIQWVLSRKADTAAIDSHVLEQTFRQRPALTQAIQIVHSIGPMPTPPLALSNHLSGPQVAKIRQALLLPDATLSRAMKQAHVRRYVEVTPDYYLPLLEMVQAAQDSGFMWLR